METSECGVEWVVSEWATWKGNIHLFFLIEQCQWRREILFLYFPANLYWIYGRGEMSAGTGWGKTEKPFWALASAGGTFLHGMEYALVTVIRWKGIEWFRMEEGDYKVRKGDGWKEMSRGVNLMFLVCICSSSRVFQFFGTLRVLQRLQGRRQLQTRQACT